MSARNSIDFNLPMQLLALAGIVTIGASVYRPVLNLTISDMCFFALFLFLIGRGFKRLTLHSWVTAGAGLVAVGGLLSSLNAFDPGDSVVQLAKFVFVFLVLLVLIPNLFTTRRQFEWVCWAALLSGVINAVAAVIEYRLGHHLFEKDQGLEWRMQGLTTHTNELGDHCALMALVGMYLIRQRLLPGLIALVLTMLCLVGMALSVSIGAAVAFGVGIAVYVVLQGRVRLYLIVAALAVTMSLAYGSLFQVKHEFGQSLAERLSIYVGESSNVEDTTLGSRFQTYREAMTSIQRNPLIGVGSDEASATTKTGDEVHNIFLLAWYQTGILGLLGVPLIIFVPFANLWRRYRQSNRALRHAVCCMIALWVGAVLIDSEGPVFFQRINWLPFSIIWIYLFNVRKWPAMPPRRAASFRPAVLAPSRPLG